MCVCAVHEHSKSTYAVQRLSLRRTATLPTLCSSPYAVQPRMPNGRLPTAVNQ